MNKNKKIFIILASVIALSVLGVFSTLNRIVGLDEKCKADWSQVLNQYQRRYDLIPNLVATVEGYTTHEKDTLIQVVDARNKATQTTLSPEMLSDENAMVAFMQNQNALSSALSRLMVVVERYPELKANENRIAVARRDYIDSVRLFNTKVRMIPTKWIVAAFSDMELKASFDIEEIKQEVPVVKFSR